MTECPFCTRDSRWDKEDGDGVEWNGKRVCHECSLSYQYEMKPQIDGHLCGGINSQWKLVDVLNVKRKATRRQPIGCKGGGERMIWCSKCQELVSPIVNTTEMKKKKFVKHACPVCLSIIMIDEYTDWEEMVKDG